MNIIEEAILDEYINYNNQNNKNDMVENEFEIRFGKFIFDKNTNKNTFQSGVEISFYYNLKKYLLKNNLQFTEIKTVEHIYNNPQGKGNIKKIMEENKEPVYILKNLYKKYNIYDYDVRIAMSSEKKLKVNYIKGINFNSKPNCVREKSRLSFLTNFGKIDLTIVRENNGVQKYEVELEITTGDKNLIKSVIHHMIQIRQENHLIMSNTEKRKIFNHYKEITGATYFVGVQPENLQRDQINILYKELYSVTDKADGDRFFLFIDADRQVYLLDNNLNNFIKTNILSSVYYSTIIDGELLKLDDKIKFLAFDLIAYNGKDIRGNNEYFLKERLNRLNNIVGTVSNNSSHITIEMKKFIYRNVFLGGEILLEAAAKKEYENDGLIFTPMNEAYPKMKKWSKLVKWKPGEMNTIDFYAIKTGQNEWELYVQHLDSIEGAQSIERDKQRYENTLVLFDVEKLCGEKTEITTYKTEFSDSDYKDPITEEPYMTNTVIEFKYNKELKKFVPIRTRWDKTLNTKKHGNYSSVACDIWKNIENPITKDFLLSFNNNSTKGDNESFFFDSMRSFHNKIKEYLYKKYCNNTEYLLELCSGKGGDLHKWYYNKIQHVTGYDVCEDSIREANRRLKQLETKHNTKLDYKFNQIDLTKDNLPKENKYDNICCQFGLHYFFQNKTTFEKIVENIDDNIKKDGYFICTFIDNDKLHKLESTLKCENNEILYYIKYDKGVTDTMFGNKLKMYLNGENYLSNVSNEYIINWPFFVEYMKSRGFSLVESECFDKLYKQDFELKQYEKDISFIYRYSVWKKGETENINIQTFNKHEMNIYDISKEVSFKNYEKYNLNFIKIRNTYDIITLLNCIECKYNYHEYKNVILNDTNLQDVLQNLNVKDADKELYFYYNKYESEKENDINTENNEKTVYHNWYIIARNNILYSTKEDVTFIENCIDKLKIGNESDQSDQSDQGNVRNESGIIKKSQDVCNVDLHKLTIKDLKEKLKICNLKTTGKKQELIERLIENKMKIKI